MFNMLFKIVNLGRIVTGNNSNVIHRALEFSESALVVEQEANIKKVIRESGLTKQQVKDGLDLSKPVSEVLNSLVDSSSSSSSSSIFD